MTMDTGRAVALAALVALALRLTVGLALPLEPSWDGVVYERAATLLARGESYDLRALNPAAPAHESAFYPVGWPGALALWRAVGMPRRLDLLFAALLGALMVPLTAWLAARIAGPERARAAAWAVALWPGGILASPWMGETLFSLLILLALIPLTGTLRVRAPDVLGGSRDTPHRRDGPQRWPVPPPRYSASPRRPASPLAPIALRNRHHHARLAPLIVSGLAFGLAAFVRPTALAIAPLAAFAAGWSADPSWRRPRRALVGLGSALLVLALSFAVLSPWILRNAREVGAPVISTNGGTNLLLGTVSARYAAMPSAIDCPYGMYELDRDRCRRRRALARIAHAPLSWLALAPFKLAHTFAYETSSAVQLGASLGMARPTEAPAVRVLAGTATAYWLALLFAAALSLGRVRHRALMLAPFLALSAVHAVFIGGDRYHAPLVPLAAALASPLLASFATRVSAARAASLD